MPEVRKPWLMTVPMVHALLLKLRMPPVPMVRVLPAPMLMLMPATFWVLSELIVTSWEIVEVPATSLMFSVGRLALLMAVFAE